MGNEALTREIEKLSAQIRYNIIIMSTQAGSGHPTSSLSATELMACLLFGGTFTYDLDNPHAPNNDRLIFSKGHASPLFYALWAAAGKVSKDEILAYRQFSSPLEGHPSIAFPYTEAATGSLGQGLAIGLGMALNAKYLDKLPYRTYVLLGDSEMAEGSVWESMQIAAHYKLDNLVGVIDVNRLGQRGETMDGWNIESYRDKVAAFGWKPLVVDGHAIPEVLAAYQEALHGDGRPAMLIAKTIKGKGVPFLENKNGWHGKALPEQDCERALKDLGPVDTSLHGTIPLPEDLKPQAVRPAPGTPPIPSYPEHEPASTRKAFANALVRLYPFFPAIVSLDGEVSNSTYAEIFQKAHPDRCFEMYIAEQNMVGTALGLSCRGKIPVVSTYGAFLSRAYDQIRMAQYSDPNIKFIGSHGGVSVGEDGPSQMGLEDLAMFRSLLGSVVLYPADAVASERLVEAALRQRGLVYVRLTRPDMPVIYQTDETFPIGGCKVLRQGAHDRACVIAAGITLHQALEAYGDLQREGIAIRVIDLYSIKPIDVPTLLEAAHAAKTIITVEDHHIEGGLGEAVLGALADHPVPVHMLGVGRKPKSGKPGELFDYEGISRAAIVATVKDAI